MNITLITPTPPDINAFGTRILSSVLRKEGFSTKNIFLPGGIEHLKFDSSYVYTYPEKTLERIAEICSDSDLVGFSFMSLYYDRSVQITDYLRKNLKAPIIWGGTHPTYRPEECLRLCDAVCIGEGEKGIVEYARRISGGLDYNGISNFWIKTPEGVIKNETGWMVENLNALPFADYDIENHFVYDWRSGEISNIDEGIMKEQSLRLPYFKDRHLFAYRTMTSRGCPHRCSYCASSAMMKLRRRSVDNVLEELEIILRKFPYIEIISFFDDTFFAAPVEYFEEFRDKYKKRIGLPFHAQCSPSTISEKKMELLSDAGLYYTEMGIQTGSEKIKRMYRRTDSNAKIIEAASLIHKYREKLLIPDYHVILDNPWEETQDELDTLMLLLELPGKYRLEISSLVFFPGTELNDRARAEGIIKDEISEVCRKPFTFPKATYLNYLIYLSGYPIIPRGLIRFLASNMAVRMFHKPRSSSLVGLLFVLTDKIRLIGKGVLSLMKGDIKRIVNYFRLAR